MQQFDNDRNFYDKPWERVMFVFLNNPLKESLLCTQRSHRSVKNSFLFRLSTRGSGSLQYIYFYALQFTRSSSFVVLLLLVLAVFRLRVEFSLLGYSTATAQLLGNYSGSLDSSASAGRSFILTVVTCRCK